MRKSVPCTKLVITAGPWTPKAFSSLFPSAKVSIPVSSLAGHSVVLKSPRWSAEASNTEDFSSHAVFTSDPSGFSPEFFSRTGGEIWFGGLNSSTLLLPKNAGKAHPDPKAIDKLMIVAGNLLGSSEEVENLEVLREGLCFRPVSRSGEPIISRIGDGQLGGGMKTRPGGDGGVFVSTGHGPWGMFPPLDFFVCHKTHRTAGITQSLGTGKVLSELIDGLETSCDISDLQL
jgi:glycine/D-amino acid oxidase-like deaminating enzyme